MKQGIPILVVAIFSFIFYLMLTAGSGSVLLWSAEEIFAGAVFSLLVGYVSKGVVHRRHEADALSPRRWVKFALYLAYWSKFLVKSNIDVAMRVLTGRINPGIVRIDSRQKGNMGIFFLANSISLTPGTLTVDTDGKSLYVHCINAKSPKPKSGEVCGKMAEKIAEVLE